MNKKETIVLTAAMMSATLAQTLLSGAARRTSTDICNVCLLHDHTSAVLNAPPPEQFTDVNGQAQSPLSQPEKKATMLFFLLPDCPVSNAFAPEIKRICAEYEAKKIAAFVVHADPEVSSEQAKKHAKEFGLPCPVLRDPTHRLVKLTGVTMAPEVAVLGPDRKVLYRGRIDDLYVGYGKRRPAPTQRDLRDALDAILQGKAVATPRTKVIGCHLPGPQK